MQVKSKGTPHNHKQIDKPTSSGNASSEQQTGNIIWPSIDAAVSTKKGFQVLNEGEHRGENQKSPNTGGGLNHSQ